VGGKLSSHALARQPGGAFNPSPLQHYRVREYRKARRDWASCMNETATDAFKAAFRRHAAGVAVIATLDADGQPRGFTATSLASLAAVPPLLTFNMAQVSTSFTAMTVGNWVIVHMIGGRSRYLAEIMAGDHDVRFAGDHWQPGPHGVPVLNGVPAWLLARIVEVHPVHGNAIVVAEVDSGVLGTEDESLLYTGRRYHSSGALEL